MPKRAMTYVCKENGTEYGSFTVGREYVASCETSDDGTVLEASVKDDSGFDVSLSDCGGLFELKSEE